MNEVYLLALKIERRCIAAAVYRGRALQHLQQRTLSYEENVALKSVDGFLEWLINGYKFRIAALELLPHSSSRRALIRNRVRQVLSRHGIPTWDVDRKDLVSSYGLPEPKLTETRQIAQELWPVLEMEQDRPALIDTAALGAYVQVQRSLAAALERTPDAVAP